MDLWSHKQATSFPCKKSVQNLNWVTDWILPHPQGIIKGGVLPYMDSIGMCRCEGYGFQAVYSRVGYINQSVWV